jgi:two-component system, OmpR family, KDP operon response regulator KdpE
MKTSQRPRILIIDADPTIRQMLAAILKPSGSLISQTDSGAAVLSAVGRNRTDLLLMHNLELSDMNGLDIIRRIRLSGSTIPVILLSGHADDNDTAMEAFDLSADASITKPFGVEELLARIRVLPRHRLQRQAQLSGADELQINLNRCSVMVRGIEVKLSPREYDLLHLLIMHAGNVLTHGFILHKVWGRDSDASTDLQYLRIYIRSIRRKIELIPEQPKILVTKQGIGYRLNCRS